MIEQGGGDKYVLMRVGSLITNCYFCVDSVAAALMRNSGTLFANDANGDRAKAVVSNLHRMGVHNAVVSTYDARVFPKVTAQY